MYLAIDSMFLAIAMSLATLNIDKKKDANGQYIEPQVEYTTGSIRYIFSRELSRLSRRCTIFTFSIRCCLFGRTRVLTVY